ncbi:MAG: methyl-accepting chemotaxis protein [Pseudomonadota bacterium]
MVGYLRRLSVANALALLSVLGIVAVMVYAGGRIAQDVQHAQTLRRDASLTRYTDSIGKLNHTLQRERAASILFVASEGESAGSDLGELRAASDVAIQELLQKLELLEPTLAGDARLGAIVMALREHFAQLPETRRAISALTSDPLVFLEDYTQVSRDLISLMSRVGQQVSSPEIASAMQLHAIFMTAKNKMALEWALGSLGLQRAQRIQGPFPRDVYTLFETRISQKEAMLVTYRDHGSLAKVAAFDDLTRNDGVQAMMRMKTAIRSFDPREIGAISPRRWTSASAATLDTYMSVELRGAANIDQLMQAAIDTLRESMLLSLAKLAVVLTILGGASFSLVRLTNTSLRCARREVAAMAEGAIHRPITQALQSDFGAITAALEAYRQGEVARLAEADMQESLERGAAEGIKRVAEAVERGDFSQRLDLEGLHGPSQVLGNGINEILKVADGAVRVQQEKDAQELARREAEAVAQERAVTEIQSVVEACSHGHFDRRMSLDGLSGVWFEVAQAINRISERTGTALGDLSGIMTALEGGDLSRRLDDEYSGTFHDISVATNASLEQLERAFAKIHDGVQSVGHSAAELRAGTGDLARRSEEQAQAVFESAAVTDDIAKSVTANAEQLTECRKLVEAIAARTTSGQDVSTKAIDSIAAIEHASEQMVKIVRTIDEIAFQTNLLALNASVEAARAGDAGKGFGVVASEVRALAARCADASQQIGSLINEAVRSVKQGAEHVRDTGRAIGEMQGQMMAVEDKIEAVYSAGASQKQGVGILNRSIKRVEEIAQSNAALAEENNSLMASLGELDAQLSQALAAFTLSTSVRGAAPKSEEALTGSAA